MSAAFLAVAIIMILLIVFAFVLLHGLSVTAGVRIRADMVRLLTAYDDLIDNKSKEINRLKEEAEEWQRRVEEARENAAAVKLVPPDGGRVLRVGVPTAAVYRPRTFRGSYGSVRDGFHMAAEEQEAIVEYFDSMMDLRQGQEGRGEAAQRLRDNLSFDTIFQLSQMSENQQLELLEEVLDDESWELLESFHESLLGSPFHIVEFYDWLKEVYLMEGIGISVRCGDPVLSKQIGVDYRPEICEGIQIVADNCLYDYSIKERELS